MTYRFLRLNWNGQEQMSKTLEGLMKPYETVVAMSAVADEVLVLVGDLR